MTDPATEPWTTTDLLHWHLTAGAGALAIAVGWIGSSGTAALGSQYGWLSLAVAGLALTGAGNCLWLLGARRAIRGRRRVLVATLAVQRAPATTAGPADEALLVSTNEMRRFHRPGCELAAGKDTRSAPLAVHVRAGRRPCGVCDP